MPRYFFTIHDGISLPDEDGTELRDAEDARTQAVIAAGEALRDTGRRFWDHPDWSMVVTDESGAIVCRLRFAAL
jgi:hypothetical protein